MWEANRIFIIDLATKSFRGLFQPENITSYGIDGLYYYKNSLIAVQNQMQRIVRFFLYGSTGRGGGLKDYLGLVSIDRLCAFGDRKAKVKNF